MVEESVHISAYDPQWPVLFGDEACRISGGLPEDLAIEHIGSTAVPGLAAKPIIDIMVGAEAYHDITGVRAALAALDYEDLGEAGVPGRIYFRRRAGTAFNIALVARGDPLWTCNLALRNYLRTNPDAAREYADVKYEAFNRGTRSLLAYSAYKSAVVTRLIDQALQSKPHDSPAAG